MRKNRLGSNNVWNFGFLKKGVKNFFGLWNWCWNKNDNCSNQSVSKIVWFSKCWWNVWITLFLSQNNSGKDWEREREYLSMKIVLFFVQATDRNTPMWIYRNEDPHPDPPLPPPLSHDPATHQPRTCHRAKRNRKWNKLLLFFKNPI